LIGVGAMLPKTTAMLVSVADKLVMSRYNKGGHTSLKVLESS